MLITKTQIFNIIKNSNHEEVLDNLNKLISPNKKLQPHKGCNWGKIRINSDCCWTTINFPQWVMIKDSYDKYVIVNCDAAGDYSKNI